MRIPALYMRGGTSKGVFFNAADLPVDKGDFQEAGIAFSAADYVSSANVVVNMDRIDILARILSMGKMHHAFTATGSIALAVAAALPGSVVARNLRKMSSEMQPEVLRIGHASGHLAIGATVRHGKSGWQIRRSCLAVRVS